ncbi:MAG: DNA primase [Lentihominibacter sp.]
MADNRISYNYNTVDEIKSRCNIVDVIGEVVTLKKAGSIYKGVCPFHKEKTPSFVVYEQTQTYKCFGCGEGGDVFSFVMKHYNLDFSEALEMLAKKCGVEITKNRGQKRINKELYEITRLAARYYYRALRESANPGLAYMRKRGLSDNTLNSFGIGYADDSWTSLTDYLTGEGFNPDDLVELGLASKKNGRYFDYFRGRVMFPIQDTSGKVIGFGGRIISDGTPKYLNSKESSVFQKKFNLYGLNLTREYAAKEDRIFLVEGYMDVISLYQAGVRNVSASLGTALTEGQARLIKRYTSNVILSYDADDAGQNAALRGLDILYGEECRAKVLVVSDGKDPDEFIKAHGRGEYLSLADKALPYGDFKLKKIKEKYDIRDRQEKLLYLEEALNMLKDMKPVEADMYMGLLSEETGISEAAIRAQYTGAKAGSPEHGTFRRREEEQQSGISAGEEDLLKLMLIDHEYTKIPGDIKDELFNDPVSSALFEAITENDSGERPLNIRKIRDSLDVNGSELLKKVSDKVISIDREKKVFDDCISHFRRRKLKREEEEIRQRLNSDGDVSIDETDRLMMRLMEIQKQLKG